MMLVLVVNEKERYIKPHANIAAGIVLHEP
jgi:hypothetical protein